MVSKPYSRIFLAISSQIIFLLARGNVFRILFTTHVSFPETSIITITTTGIVSLESVYESVWLLHQTSFKLFQVLIGMMLRINGVPLCELETW